jgi:autotransporter-associated beta strand protein
MIRRVFRLSAIAFVASVQFPSFATAQSGDWNQTGAGSVFNWGDAANWAGGLVASGANNTATFATAKLVSDAFVNLDSARTIGGLVFDNPTNLNNWIVTGNSALTLSTNAAGGPTIAVNNGAIGAIVSTAISGTQGLTKTGPGILVLDGNYTGLTGGVTVLAGTLSLPKGSPINPLGTNAITLSGGTLQIGRQIFPSISPTAFNQVTVVPHSLVSSAVTVTMDGGTARTGYTFIDLPAGVGLPHPQTNNDSLFLDARNVTGTVALINPVALSTISFLGSTGNGDSITPSNNPTVTAKLNYADGTPSATTTAFNVPDWLATSSVFGPHAYSALRVNLTGTYAPNLGYLWNRSITNPNPNDPIASISLSWSGGASPNAHTAIFAVSGTPLTYAQDYSANNITVTTDSGIALPTTTAVTFGKLSIGSNTLILTGTALTFGGASLTGNPTFSIGTTLTVTPGLFTDGGSARTITMIGGGTLVAGIPAPNLSAGTNVVVNGGTLNLNSATAFGPSPNVSVSNAGSVLNLAPGTNPSLASLSGASAGLVVLNGNQIAIGGSSSTTYGGAIQDGSAAGSIVKVGSGTLSLFGVSTFTGGITIANGTLVGTVSGTLSTGPIILAGGNLTVGAGTVTPYSVAGFGGLGSGWTANGSASFPAANTLQLTPNTGSQAGSAWFNSRVPVGPFTLSFTYSVPNSSGTPGEGITFGFQNQATKPLNALGTSGDGFGIFGIAPSAAGEINILPALTSGASGSGIGVLANNYPGAMLTTATAPGGVNTGTTTPTNVVVTYDGANMVFQLTQGANTYTSPALPLNIGGAVGSATAYFGFTGATGGATAQQIISNLVFNSLTQNNYSNDVSLVVPAGTIRVLANAAVSTVNLATLTMAANSTLSVSPDPSNLVGTPFGLTFTGTTLNGAGTFIVANTAAGAGTLSLGPVTNGTGVGSINLNGGGTLILGAPSTYTGGTTVNAGTLQVSNSSGSATGAGPVTIASGGSLNGGTGGGSASPFADSTQGFISGMVIVQAGGFVFRGMNGPGLLTVNGGFNFQSGAEFSVYLASENPRTGALPIDLNTNSRVVTPLDFLFGGSLMVPIDGGGQTFAAGSTFDFFIGQDRGTFGSLPSSVTFVPTDFGNFARDFRADRFWQLRQPGRFLAVAIGERPGLGSDI